MSGVLERPIQIEAMDFDDVVISATQMSPSRQPSPHQTHHSPSDADMMDSAMASVSPSTGEMDRTITPTGNVSVYTDEVTDECVCRDFIQQTCGCKRACGRPCSSLFSKEYYVERRAQASLLTRSELDLVMLGSIMSTTRTDDITHGRHQPVKRQRARAQYMHNGHEICKVTFGFIFGVGRKHKIDSIRRHYVEEGLLARVHKNSQLRPHNALTFDDVASIVNFLESYCEQHAILLPGRIPGYKRDDMKLLPSSNSKKVLIYICTII